jgi:hypothetical protein
MAMVLDAPGVSDFALAAIHARMRYQAMHQKRIDGWLPSAPGWWALRV